MLSRTADHLYWMARYTERAENLARMLDVHYRMSMLPNASVDRNWGAILRINELDGDFAHRYGGVTQANVVRYMAFDADNPSSIYSCLRAARENAHAVRGTLTSELWETINSTWLKMRATRPEAMENDPGAFFEWVKFRSHVYRGVSVGTMLHDEAFNFARLGTYLERGDNTARLLDVKYHVLLPHQEAVGGAADYYQWGALLKSVSAFEIYRKVYRDAITPMRVAELLVLRADMPRSLHRCMDEVYANLELVANSHSRETLRRAGELHANLHYGAIEDIFEGGLHEFVNDFLARINDIGSRITEDFLVPMAA
ncbi:MAG: alpha-E domain-containing protein [Rhodocyclaceae bacterium]|nr:alpha-E domain-containing protein [Rhodocyclaceae bacterium]